MPCTPHTKHMGDLATQRDTAQADLSMADREHSIPYHGRAAPPSLLLCGVPSCTPTPAPMEACSSTAHANACASIGAVTLDSMTSLGQRVPYRNRWSCGTCGIDPYPCACPAGCWELAIHTPVTVPARLKSVCVHTYEIHVAYIGGTQADCAVCTPARQTTRR